MKFEINQHNASNSAEETFNGVIKLIRKFLITYLHLIIKPRSIIAFVLMRVDKKDNTYITPYSLLIVSIFLCAEVIKADTYKAINGVDVLSIESYDKFLNSYGLFSTLLYVLVILVTLFFFAEILLVFFRIITKLIMPFSTKNNTGLIIQNLIGRKGSRVIRDLQFYYASLYLLVLSMCSAFTRYYSNINHDKLESIVIIIEISIIVYVAFFFIRQTSFRRNESICNKLKNNNLGIIVFEIYNQYKDFLNLWLPKRFHIVIGFLFFLLLAPIFLIILLRFFLKLIWLILKKITSVVFNKVVDFFVEVLLSIINISICRKKSSVERIASFYFYLLFSVVSLLMISSAIHFVNPLSKGATKSVLKITGQDKYTAPVGIYGFNKDDELLMEVIKGGDNQLYLQMKACLKNNQEVEMVLRKEKLIRLFKDSEIIPIMDFFDTCCENRFKEEFIKLTPGSYSCYLLRTRINSSDTLTLYNKVRKDRLNGGSLIKPIIVASDKKNDEYYQKIKIKLI